MKCKTIRILLSVALLAGVLFALTSCNSQKKLTEEYRSGVAGAKTTITTANRAFTDAVTTFFSNTTEETKQAVLAALDQLDTAYQLLGSFTPPDAYADTQTSLTEAAGLAVQAITAYRQQFESLDPSATALSDPFVEGLLGADELLRQANGKLNDAADAVADTET